MRNEHEQRLDFLSGDWRSSDRSYPGEGAPATTSEGSATYHWSVGGKWLLYMFKTELPGLGPYTVHGGVAYDQQSECYRAYAVNSLGLLMVYDGAWETDDRLVFSLVYPNVSRDTRVSYTNLPEGKVRMTSERPAEGGGRELYFETWLER